MADGAAAAPVEERLDDRLDDDDEPLVLSPELAAQLAEVDAMEDRHLLTADEADLLRLRLFESADF